LKEKQYFKISHCAPVRKGAQFWNHRHRPIPLNLLIIFCLFDINVGTDNHGLIFPSDQCFRLTDTSVRKLETVWRLSFYLRCCFIFYLLVYCNNCWYV